MGHFDETAKIGASMADRGPDRLEKDAQLVGRQSAGRFEEYLQLFRRGTALVPWSVRRSVIDRRLFSPVAGIKIRHTHPNPISP
jgi:hypothetical protein